MILAVCLNLALDLTYRVPSLRLGATTRVEAVFERAGGKAVNVARVLDALGHDVVVTGFAGGRVGAAVVDELDAAGLAHSLVPVAGQTRRTLIVVDGRPEPTGLSEPGPDIAPAEWAAFEAAFAGLARDASAVVLAGSLPPGVPPGAYASLIAAADGVPVLLDTSGEPLALGAAAGPAVLKVNREELGAAPRADAAATADPDGVADGDRALGAGHDDVIAADPAFGAAHDDVIAADPALGAGHDDVIAAARGLRAAGAGAVVVSLGEDGLVAVTAEGDVHAPAPAVVSGNPIGAGDAASAAIVAGLVAGTPWRGRLDDAAALAAASVHSPVAGSFDAAAYERYRR